MVLTESEPKYHTELRNMTMNGLSDTDKSINFDVAGTGARWGGSFKNTHELRVMKYPESMK